jgi:hypothetical protein
LPSFRSNDPRREFANSIRCYRKPTLATLRLATLFRDPGSRAFYRSVCNEVARGQLPARVPVAAVGSARGPGVRNAGACFCAHIKRCKATAEARRR